jgi:23S rRNA-/tRNA-specific pseudouridylate synthase
MAMIVVPPPRCFSCLAHLGRRQNHCRNNRRTTTISLLILLAVVVSFNTSRNQSPTKQSSAFVFVSSFASRNLVRLTPSSWPFFITHDKNPKGSRYEEILSVQRHESKLDRIRYPNHGSASALASALSPPTPKPPAPTDWVVVEEYPMVSPDGIDPYRILDNNNKNIRNSSDDNDSTNTDSNEKSATKYLDAIQRLNVTQHNLTLPVALMSLDTHRFPTLSNARKACRQGKIVLRSSAASTSKSESSSTSPPSSPSTAAAFRKGLVGDRVYPLDCISRRELYKNLPTKNSTSSSTTTSYETLGDGFVKSKFQNLHVAYEDNYMALVVKPAGLLVHPQGKNGGWGRKNNVLNALPYFLHRPPGPSVVANADENDADDSMVLDRPVPVHRLDFATSGLLVAAKTKGASRLLAQEFEYRKARKTYTAMVYGIPVGNSNSESLTIPSFFGPKDGDGNTPVIDEARTATADGLEETKANEERLDNEDLGDDDCFEGDIAGDGWNFADCFLDNKQSRTRWRLLGSQNCSVPIRYHNDNDEKDDTILVSINVPISIIEMKPKTGRYHQLRRTMAWLYNTPIVGDTVYSTNFIEENFLPDNAEIVEQQQVRDYRASLMLCSNEIDVAHPYYNTAAGRLEWKDTNKSSQAAAKANNDLSSSSSSSLYESKDGIVRVTAAIELPKKFTKFIDMMERKKKNAASKE